MVHVCLFDRRNCFINKTRALFQRKITYLALSRESINTTSRNSQTLTSIQVEVEKSITETARTADKEK